MGGGAKGSRTQCGMRGKDQEGGDGGVLEDEWDE